MRTQIQIDKATWEALRHRAFREKESLSAVVRKILRDNVNGKKKHRERTCSIKHFAFVASGRSGGKSVKVSENHDDELANSFAL